MWSFRFHSFCYLMIFYIFWTTPSLFVVVFLKKTFLVSFWPHSLLISALAAGRQFIKSSCPCVNLSVHPSICIVNAENAIPEQSFINHRVYIQNELKYIEIDPKWITIYQNWSKMDQNDSKWSQNVSKFIQICNKNWQSSYPITHISSKTY